MSRRVIGLLVLMLLATDGAALKPAPPTMATGFDHRSHGQALAKASVNALTCISCHDANAATAVRRHKTCFGKCHGKVPRRARKNKPYRLGNKRKRVCTACHAPRVLLALAQTGATPPAVTLPLPKRRRDLALTTGVYPVGRSFSHARHRAKSKARCQDCHGGVLLALNNKPRRPTKPACATCHNGAKAFAMTEAKCRKCHQRRGDRIQRHTAKLVRFSHKNHARRGYTNTCASCHQLSSNGTPLGAARNHAPCSDSNCHRADFKSLRPTTCNACHVAKQPWRPLHRDRGARPETEFGARFSHKAHLSGTKPRISVGCASCHQLTSGKRELRLLRNHASCVGRGCHARRADVKSAARPALSACTTCHRLELVRKHQLKRHTARWSVRTTFRHRPHQAIRGQATTGRKSVPCRQCHAAVMASVALRDIPPPGKKSCIGCHDGGAAFKLTGHKCSRCHGHSR